MTDKQGDYVQRYKNTNDPVEGYIGRVEAKYDRIEAKQTVDPGHQRAIGETGAAARKSMGYTKQEIKKMGWTEGTGPNAK